MAKRILNSTPKKDGYRMPGEYEPQEQIWMFWPERGDVWRNGALPAQRAFARVAEAISRFEPVTMLASDEQYENCRAMCPPEVTVLELSSNDAWARDIGPTFLIDGKGDLRACDWTFNAWGTAFIFPGIRTTGRRKRSASWQGQTLTARKALCWRAAPSMWTGRERR